MAVRSNLEDVSKEEELNKSIPNIKISLREQGSIIHIKLDSYPTNVARSKCLEIPETPYYFGDKSTQPIATSSQNISLTPSCSRVNQVTDTQSHNDSDPFQNTDLVFKLQTDSNENPEVAVSGKNGSVFLNLLFCFSSYLGLTKLGST